MPNRIERALVHRSHPDFKKFDGLCFLAKNLYNSTVYDIRQVIFENRERRTEGKKLLKVPSHYDLVTLYAKNDDVDYRAAADALKRIDYSGVVSIEMRPGEQGENVKRVEDAVSFVWNIFE